MVPAGWRWGDCGGPRLHRSVTEQTVWPTDLQTEEEGADGDLHTAALTWQSSLLLFIHNSVVVFPSLCNDQHNFFPSDKSRKIFTFNLDERFFRKKQWWCHLLCVQKNRLCWSNQMMNPVLSGCLYLSLFFICADCQTCSSIHVEEKSIKLVKPSPAVCSSILDIYSHSQSQYSNTPLLCSASSASRAFSPLLIPLSIDHLLSSFRASWPRHNETPTRQNDTGPARAVRSRHDGSESICTSWEHKWRIGMRQVSPSGTWCKKNPSPHISPSLVIRSQNTSMDSWPLAFSWNPSCQSLEWTR